MLPATLPEHVEASDGQTVSVYVKRVGGVCSWNIAGPPLLWSRNLTEYLATARIIGGSWFIEPKNFDPAAFVLDKH